MDVPRDPAASRYEHIGKGLRRGDLNRDPIKQFANWFTGAIEAGIRDVNAMSLATAGPDARPSVRIVLLKSFDHDGFVFFTNYESEKGRQLEANPYAALAFYWVELDRQVRITGKTERTSREESQAYFHSRTRRSHYRRTGAGTESNQRPSNSGRAAQTVYTTDFVTRGRRMGHGQSTGSRPKMLNTIVRTFTTSLRSKHNNQSKQ